ARLEQIEGAAREHGEQRRSVSERIVEAQNARLATQRSRIRELESLGPLSAAKFAVGQRVRSALAARKKTKEKKGKS
ncbi:MAG: hypothetical protein M3Y66_02500, partial [Actinomycetota bacterium]|nr:hypothetical protein [Actinomycetota bacterium]